MKTVLITGAAKRIGEAIAIALHRRGWRVILHARNSVDQVQLLASRFNADSADSARWLTADLDRPQEVERLAQQALDCWGCMDALINNASSFYPTPLSSVKPQDSIDLMGSNLYAPLFLTSVLADSLRARAGCIVNVTDSRVRGGVEHYSLYAAAKAGLEGLTKVLARELAPQVRVNAVAPGAILWPMESGCQQSMQHILDRVVLGRTGCPDDIAAAVIMLLQASYVTGEVLCVDGGRF